MPKKLAYTIILFLLMLSACTLFEPSFPTIKVRDCNPISIKELLSHIQYTPLETPDSIAVAEVNKLIPFEDRYYILDNQVEGDVYCFLQNGKFLFQLNAQGNGKGKYRFLENIAIDPFRRQLEVYDRGGLKLVRYDLDGNFVEEVPCPYYFEDFGLIDTNQYALYGLGISNFFSLNDSSFNSFMIIDRNFRYEITQGLPYMEPLHKVFFEGRLWTMDWQAWGAYGFQDTIYEITVDTIAASFKVDFGQKQLPGEIKSAIMKSDSAMDRLVEILDAPYAKGIHHILKTDKHLSFDFRTTNKQHFQTLYDFQTQSCQCIPNFYIQDGWAYQSPIAMEADTFVSLIFAKDLLDSLKKVEDLKLSEELLNVKDQLAIENNPVVVRVIYE